MGILFSYVDTVGIWRAAVTESLKTLVNFNATVGVYIPPTRLTDAAVGTQGVVAR